ncbi:MAG: glutamate--tRNA ligase [Alphaproteobacteria bacterium]|nr:glutamate--tRNA ligase [Alphaproteobacteria bacterium]
MQVITRFAPSPTGFLHIGSARTALFNYLFAKHFGGKFLLRIEDTDLARSTIEANNAILEGLKWLNINYDGEVVYQSQNIERHREVALQLIEKGAAYRCFMSKAEIEGARNESINKGESFILKSPWREKHPSEYPANQEFVVRIKAPRISASIISDIVQGEVAVESSTLDDMILLRSDGTPTYMLAVVVDDHDMGVTHIIRGDDHLNNGFRQKMIYEAMNWNIPIMGHIPLIHGPDGAKLSKRHGALGVNSYEEMGYLPEALVNYLMRLGWSHGDEEIITIEKAIEWFDGTHIGKGPTRIDFAKMAYVNSVYLKQKDDEALMDIIRAKWKKEEIELDEVTEINLRKALPSIKIRSSLSTDLAELAKLYHRNRIYNIEEGARDIIQNTDPKLMQEICALLESMDCSGEDKISASFKEYALTKDMKLGDLMKIVRGFLTGKTSSPSIFELINIIGKNAAIERIQFA